MKIIEFLTTLLGLPAAVIYFYKNRKHMYNFLMLTNNLLNSRYGKYFQIMLAVLGVLLSVFAGGLTFAISLSSGGSIFEAAALSILTATSFIPLAYLTFKNCVQISPSKNYKSLS